MHTIPLGRRSARAIIIDSRGQLLLIKRIKPGLDPYWTVPGGGIEESDTSIEAALRRELSEELGVKAESVSQVFLSSSILGGVMSIQYFFVTSLSQAAKPIFKGPELADPSRGKYELENIDLLGDQLLSVDLKPPELKEFILANRMALLNEATTQPDGWMAVDA